MTAQRSPGQFDAQVWRVKGDKFMICWRSGLYFVLHACFFAAMAHVAAEEPPVRKLPAAVARESEKIRRVLEQNFTACNEEDVKKLMATISPTMPGSAEFHNEAKQMFADTDVYLSLDDFELIDYRPPFAVARVVQITLPKDEKDREAGSELQQKYRGSTALLPEWERAVYTQSFKKEGGKWRLYGILGRPAPAESSH